ncbi:TRAP1, partial [Symbiodinium sp. KB8]
MASLVTSTLRRKLWKTGSSTLTALSEGIAVGADLLPWGPQTQDRRFYRNRGVLKLHCSECRYVIRRWHIPILAVDCSANVRHKQALTNPPIRSRWSTQFPEYLRPWVEGKQYPRHPHYRQAFTFQCYHKTNCMAGSFESGPVHLESEPYKPYQETLLDNASRTAAHSDFLNISLRAPARCIAGRALPWCRHSLGESLRPATVGLVRASRWSRAFSTETHEFKAETKKLLDIVAKSLYTDKEVFIRELISNASDACEKLRFLQGTQQIKDVNDADVPLQVTLSVSESDRKFIIEDSGIGMTHDELDLHDHSTMVKGYQPNFSPSQAQKLCQKVRGTSRTSQEIALLLQPLLEDWKSEPKLATSTLKNLRADAALVLNILGAMSAFRLEMIAQYFNIAIDSCGRSGRWAQALLVLRSMSLSEVLPSAVSYTNAINACRKASKWTQTLHLLWHALESRLSPDAVLFGAAMNACAGHGKWEAAFCILSNMHRHHVEPGVVSYNIILNALDKGGKWRKALELYFNLPSHGVLANAVSSNTAITAAARHSQWQGILDVLARLPGLGPASADADTFANSLQGLAKAWRWEEATSLLVARMSSKGGMKTSLSVLEISAAMTACSRSTKWEWALSLLGDAQRMNADDGPLYTTAITACGRSTKWRVSLSLFADVFAKRLPADIVTYTTALAACEGGSWQQSICLLSNLRQSRLNGTLSTYALVTRACASAEQWQSALSLLTELRDEAVEPDVVLCTSVACACTAGGHWHKALHLFLEMQLQRIKADGPAINAAIAACDKGGDWRRALLFFADFPCERNQSTCTAAISACSGSQQWQQALRLLKLWQDDDRGGGPPLASCLPCTAAVSVCGRARQWERALALLDSMSKASVADTAMFNAAISAAGDTQWQLALEVFARLTWSDVPPDAISYSATMNACVEASQWSTSILLLEECLKATIETSVPLLNTAISAWVRCAAWQPALSLMAQLQEQHLECNEITQSALIHACGCSLRWNAGLQILEATRACDLRANSVAFGAIAYSGYRSQMWHLAISVLESMCTAKMQPSLATYDYALLAAEGAGHREQAFQVLFTSEEQRNPHSFLWAVATLRTSDPVVIHAACTEALTELCKLDEMADTDSKTLSRTWWSVGILGARGPAFERLMLQQAVVQLRSFSSEELSMISAGASMTGAFGFLNLLQEELATRASVSGEALNDLSFSDAMEVLGILFSCRSVGCLRATSYSVIQGRMRSLGRLLDASNLHTSPGTGTWNPKHAEASSEQPRVALSLADRFVVHKPDGWEVYGAHVKLQLLEFVQGMFGRTPIFQDPGHNYGFLHRLDVPSSGLILVAKTYEAFYDLQTQLHAGEVGRDYTVLCHGWLPRSVREISASTWCEDDRPTLSGGRGKPSATQVCGHSHYLHEVGALSKVLLGIATGRKHQIRSHMAHIGHPTVRDRTYAGKTAFNFDVLLCSRNWLHRHRLRFRDLQGRKSDICSHVPEDLEASLERATLIRCLVTGHGSGRCGCVNRNSQLRNSGILHDVGRLSVPAVASHSTQQLFVLTRAPNVSQIPEHHAVGRAFGLMYLQCSWMVKPVEAVVGGSPDPWQHALERSSQATGRLPGRLYSASARTASVSRQWGACLEVLRQFSLTGCVDSWSLVITYGASISGCADSWRWRTSLSLARTLQHAALQLNTVICNACISTAQKRGQWQQSLVMLDQIAEATLEVDVFSCGGAIGACEKSGRWDNALLLLEDLELKALQANIVTFSAALSACARDGKWQQALITEMQQRQIQPTTVTYNSLITSCHVGQAWQRSLASSEKLRRNQLYQSEVTIGAVGTAARGSMQWQQSLRIHSQFAAHGLDNRVLRTSAVLACAGRDQWQLACQLLSVLHASFVRLGTDVCNACITALGRQSLWQHGAIVFSQLQHGTLPDDLVRCNVMLDGFEKCGMWQRALCILGIVAMTRLLPDVVTCTSSISACGRAGSWLHSGLILQQLDDLGLQGNIILHNAVIAAWERSHQWELSMRTIGLMHQKRLEHSLNAFDSALLACQHSGRTDLAWQLCRDSEAFRSPVSFLWSLASLGVSDPTVINAACASAAVCEVKEVPYLMWSCAILGVEPSPHLRRFLRRSLASPKFLALEMQAVSMAVYGAGVLRGSALEFLSRVQEALRARLHSQAGMELERLAFHRAEGQELLGVLFSCSLEGALRAGFRDAVACKLQDLAVAFDRCRFQSRFCIDPKNQTTASWESATRNRKNPEIFAETRDRFVVHKPDGWEVYGAHVKLQLLEFVQGMFGRAPIFQDPGHNYGFLHRLDVPSSGLILVAKTYEAFYDLQTQLHAGEVGRDYTVLCHGWLPSSVREISASTVCLTDAPTVAGGRGRKSVTHLRICEHYAVSTTILSRSNVSIITGRKHQIRCHMAHVGHPIVRDKIYTSFRTFQEDAAFCMRNWLHRFRLSFTDAEGVGCEVSADLPADLSRSLVNLSLHRFRVVLVTGTAGDKREHVEHLGTIAKSGSLDFLQRGESDASKIIGQFGVGFYSTFVVADKVEVYTKTADKEKGAQGYLWTSDGSGSFTVTEVDDVPRGTRIELTLKDDATEFAKLATVKKSAQKFSSFIDFPINIREDGDPKPINKQEALWMKSSATEEQHLEFFRFLSGNSYGKPYYTLMYQTDAPLSIKSCFYVPDPDNAPSRVFTKDPEIGISLHSRRVMVKKHADGVIPKWLHWMKGIVDCEDMPMNISRENMQDTRLMEKLSMAVVRRVLRFLQQEAKKDSEKYNKFFKGYSYFLKAGIIEDKEGNFSRHKDDLLKLLRFECSNKPKGELVSLEEYMSMAKEGQQNIYYFCCPDRQTALSSPYMEQFVQRQRNVLLLYEDIDEFVVNAIEGFKDSKFVSVDSADKNFELDLDKPEEDDKEDRRELTEQEKEAIQKFIRDVLKEKVQEVKFSDRLVNSPALVTSIITPHMRKMMKSLMAGKENDGLGNIPMTLELSPKHHIVTTLATILASNEPVARIAVEQLYDNACIAAGTLDDPRVLMSRLNKVLEMFIYQGAGFDYATGRYHLEPPLPPPKAEEAQPAAEETPRESAKDSTASGSGTSSKFEEIKPVPRRWVLRSAKMAEKEGEELPEASGPPQVQQRSKTRTKLRHGRRPTARQAPWKSRGSRPRQGESEYWQWWSGTWSPRQRQRMERYDDLQSDSYHGGHQPANPDLAVSEHMKFMQELQRAVTQARKMDARVRKLQEDKVQKTKLWEKYSEDTKKKFLKNRQAYHSDMEKLDQAVAAATT